MTALTGRGAGRRRRLSWTQWAGALVAVTASLGAVALPGTARGATTPTDSYDQMSGVGPTASAITVPWTAGILDDTNTAIASANADRTATSPTEPYSFMYGDFKGLSVTVSQTQNIGHQGITVNWTWTDASGNPVSTIGSDQGTVQADFLQMMECWGDASSGPTPEQCEYGSAGLLPGSAGNVFIGQRTGDLCPAGAVASTTDPPASADGDGPAYGCDPQEPGGTGTDQIAPCPGTDCAPGEWTIPFSPETDPTDLDYNGPTDTTYYSEFNTDEIQEAVTGPNGTGQVQFETLTGVQASGLGCGEEEPNSTTVQQCWLVIVPRGTYEPNGYKININTPNSYINTSPLAASNWAQRIQIHLGFSPVGSFCAPGTPEIQTFGTQIVTRAMQSWQLALNQAANCSQVYAFSAVPESTSTQNLEAGGDVGLAFTTIPIGSEAARDGEPPPTDLPTILYAPVAVTALDFGFHINYLGTDVTSPVNLTPLLLAKALTQSYKQDLPDYDPQDGSDGPSWAGPNPLNISEDPTFQAINPGVPATPHGPLAPLLTEDHSALNQQIWAWIQSSSAATTWLSGTADANDGGMVVDPDYASLNLATPPAIDSFPRAYSTCLDLGVFAGPPPKEEEKCSLDLLPYIDNYDAAASSLLTADDPDYNGSWGSLNVAPDGTLGWWGKNGVETFGSQWIWAADDTPDLAAYGQIPADLCNDAGTDCVGPTVASVTAAVSAATADSSGLLEVNPASPGTGGWPLTQIVYAAVATNQSSAALTEYADLISYAIGAGQTTGTAPGDLPAGYLPLPSSLVSQAQSVVSQLQDLASPSPSPSASSSSSASSSASASATASSSSSSAAADDTTSSDTSDTTAASTSTSAATDTTTPTPTPAPAAAATTSTPAAATSSLASIPVNSSSYRAVALSSPTTPDAVISLPQAQVAAGTTPQQAVGAFRWVLIGIAIVGGAFAGGGTMLRSGSLGSLLAWRRRRLL